LSPQIPATAKRVFFCDVTIKYDRYDGTPLEGRTTHLVIGLGKRPSNKSMMAKKIIASCPQIGSFRFTINGTDDQNRY
jgi:hypothetical protein